MPEVWSRENVATASSRGKKEKQSKNLKYANPGWSHLWRKSPFFHLSPSPGQLQTPLSWEPGAVDERWTFIRLTYIYLQLISTAKTTDTGKTKGRIWQKVSRVDEGHAQKEFPNPSGLHGGLHYSCGLLCSWHFKVSQMFNARAPNSHWYEKQGRPKWKPGSKLTRPVLILVDQSGCVSPLPSLERPSCHKRWRQYSMLSFE